MTRRPPGARSSKYRTSRTSHGLDPKNWPPYHAGCAGSYPAGKSFLVPAHRHSTRLLRVGTPLLSHRNPIQQLSHRNLPRKPPASLPSEPNSTPYRGRGDLTLWLDSYNACFCVAAGDIATYAANSLPGAHGPEQPELAQQLPGARPTWVHTPVVAYQAAFAILASGALRVARHNHGTTLRGFLPRAWVLAGILWRGHGG